MGTGNISFIHRLYISFIRVHGPSLGLLALVVAFVPMFYSLDTTIKITWLLLVIVIATLLLLVFFDAAYELHRKSSGGLPRVLTTVDPPSYNKNIQRIFLLEPSSLFGSESLISFYLDDNGIEILMGYGYVSTVQDNGNIQAALTKILDMQNETLDKIRNNDVNILRKILVKPSIPSFLLDEGM